MTEGDLARASTEFNRAIAHLREGRDRNQTAAVESLRATLLEQVGELIPAWQDRINALTRARLDARRRHTLFSSAARSCLLQQLPLAAHRFQQAVVNNAREWGQPGALVEAHLNLAVIEQRLGRPDDALESLETARRYFDAVSDARARGRFESELFTMEGEVLAQIAPEKGLAVLGQASARLSALQFNLMRARVEYASGAAAERLGRSQAALSAYLRGVDELERQREPLAASGQMQSLDLAWDMYERLITRRLYDEGPDAAFATIESARAQVLRRFLPLGQRSVPAIADLPQRLPAGTALLYFSVLERETIRWTVSRSGVTLARIPVDRQRVDYLVRRYRRILDSADRSALDRVAPPLLEVVLPPDLRATTVYVIPDGPLHELPFAALWNSTTRRFLIEDVAIGVAPSLRLFLSASGAARERFGRLDSVLLVRGRMGETPGLDPLPVLPWAAEELTATAGLYRHSRTLAENTATAAGFLGQAGRYPVVHFTGHALADRLAPDLSRLFFEPAHAGDSGWLLLRDFEQASFERTALVILAACETGAGRVLRGEGVVSLARPFLGKGVGGVVYSLWKVADEPSMRLLTALHTGLRDGLEPIVALQRAQQSLIADSRTPDARRTWPAFQYAGGASGLDETDAHVKETLK